MALNRTSSYRSSRARRIVRAAALQALEPLEDRRMFALLGIGSQLGFPSINFDSSGSVANYSSSLKQFDMVATPVSITFASGGAATSFQRGGTVGDLEIHIKVDNSGNLIGGINPGNSVVKGTNDSAGDDFRVQGRYTDPNTHAIVDGTLLTGEVAQFGWQNTHTTGTGNDDFDFRFIVTGGLLASSYANKNIGLSVVSNGSNFVGNFQVNSSGSPVEGNVAPLPKFSPSLVTNATFSSSNVVGFAIPQDSATLSGGFQETGPLTFTLKAPDGSTVDTETVIPNGNGTYNTSNTHLALQVGKYTWTVTYAGDSLNTATNDQGGSAEQVTVVPVPVAVPSIITTAGNSVVVGSGVAMTDTANLSGGNNPTGTITFNLYQLTDSQLIDSNSVLVHSETVNVSGNGNYSTPVGFVPMAAGGYQWVATYSGDANNMSVSDNGFNEGEAVTQAQPAINTTAGMAVVVGSGAPLTDTAVLAGAYNATGIITFTLFDNGIAVDSETAPVSGNGSYSTPSGFVPLTAGTYIWSASYSGDSNNSMAIERTTDSAKAAESETVIPSSPAINTVAGGPVIVGSGFPLTDTAMLTGGDHPTGTITFTLTGPGNTVVDTETVTANGDDSYSTPTGFVPTATGTYLWAAAYSGDTNNNGASDNGQNETEVVSPASPAINTVAGASVIVGSGLPLTDTAMLTGGYMPTGMITFTLTGPGNTVVDTETVNVNGDNTYSTPTGYLPTAAASYLWSASYSGDSNNASAHDNSQNESETVSPASPAINTVAGGTAVVGSGVPLTDTAVLSGGFSPTGTITFTLTGPGMLGVLDTETVTVSGNGSYSTPSGFTPTIVGSYTWSATYSGDTNNGGATDNGHNESEAVSPSSPAITTQANENASGVVGASLLSDAAKVTGGYNVGGSVTFTLTSPDGATATVGSAPVNGDGTYSSPTVLATMVGTYTWHASYSGDSLNNGAIDNGANESVTTVQASPVINTVAGGTVIVGSGSVLTDTAMLSGGDSPMGTITFTLKAQGGTTVLDTETVPVNGDNTYTTPTGYLATATGKYIWTATYSGDTNNNSATDNGQNESEVVSPSSPAINTVAGAPVIIGSGAKLTDTATLSGGDMPTGTITFTLTGPGNTVVDTETVPVSGDNTYTTPAGYLPVATGSYTWTAKYGGDSNNNSAQDNGMNESETVTPAGPAINTVAGAPVVVGSGAAFSDTAVLSGGYNETGTITFTLYSPTNVSVYTDVVTVSGNGSYTTATGNNAGGFVPTAAGTYLWSATYGGDTNNNGATDNGHNESEVVNKSGPAINTVAGAAVVVGSGAKLTDTAILTGGYQPTGTITFTLTGPGNTVVDTETVQANGDNSYTTPNGFAPTVVGTYVWSATYGGDTNNTSATDNGMNESVAVIPASPMINTVAGGSIVVGSGASFTDTATLSGGFAPTGMITFTLHATGSSTVLDTETVTVIGDNTYTTPHGYTPTAAGTYMWTATYSGDTNNSSAKDNGQNESETVSPSSPAINTTPAVVTTTGTGEFATIGFWHNQNGQALIKSFDSGPSSTLLGNALATKYPHLFGAANVYGMPSLAGQTNAQVAADYLNLWPPSGVVKNTFVQAFAVALGLYSTGGQGSFSVGSNGTAFGVTNGTTLSISTILTTLDANFNPTNGQFFGNDQSKTSLANNVVNGINVAGEQPGNNLVLSSAKLNDTAALSGGFSEIGTITFYLFAPGVTPNSGDRNNVYSDIVTVSGNGNYGTATMGNNAGGYVATTTGTYQWVAVYSGDTNNQSVTSPYGSEPQPVGQASPTIISTTPNFTSVTLGTSAVTIKDTADLEMGVNPTGTITFTLVAPSGTTVDTETATVNGDGLYTTPTGYTLPTNAAVTGTYQWNASYSGDANNTGDSFRNDPTERIVVSPGSPTINTSAGAAVLIGSGVKLTDTATLAGGYMPTGTITFTLTGPGNTLVDTEMVSASGDKSYTTPNGYLPTVAGTYLWHAVYGGDSNNSSASDNGVNESEVVTPAGPAITTTPGGTVSLGGMTISGTKFLDITGNGFSSDDTAQSGVTMDLYRESNASAGLQTGTGGDTLVGTTTTGSNGAYSFNLPGAGTYYVMESVPAGYVQTGGGPNGSAGNSYYATVATAGHSYGGENFDDFAIPTCTPTNVSYTIVRNGASTTVSTLAGNTHPGDKVTVNFTVPAGMNDQVTLVSYSAQTSGWDDSTAYQQLIYQQATGVFTPGTHSLTVTIPTTNYQIDFVCGQAIDQIEPLQNGNAYGPDSAEITYHNENRYVDSDSGGTTAGTANTKIATVPVQTTTTVGTTPLTDSATLSGGYVPGGTITFYLFAPGVTPNGTNSNNVYSDTVTVNGNGTYTVANGNNPGGYVPTSSGTYEWVAVYSGDANNKTVTSPFGSEPESAGAASPAINTVAGASVVIGSGAKLTDTATLSGGVNPTGSITFKLMSPGGSVVDTETVTVNGDNNYTTPTGYLPTAVGTYQWVATYNGDTNNNTATDNGQNESQAVNKSTPTISTQVSTVTMPGVSPGQCATIQFWNCSDGQSVICSFDGGSSATKCGNWLATNYPNLFGCANAYTSSALASCGKTSFAGCTNQQLSQIFSSLWAPNSSTAKDAYCQSFALALNIYACTSSLGGQSLVNCGAAAKYGFNVCSSGPGTYNVGNCGAAFGCANNTTLTCSQIVKSCDGNFTPGNGNFCGGDSGKTQQCHDVCYGVNACGNIPGGTTVSSGSTVKLVDSATLGGGDIPSGTVTFYLFAPGVTPNSTDSNNVYTDTVTINGDGTYSVATSGTNPGGYVPTTNGTYQWVAIYGGDANNNSVASAYGSEPQNVGSAASSIDTIPGATVTIGSGTKLTDTAQLGGGVSPTGTITFTLFNPSNVAVYTDVVTVNGNGTYTTSAGTNPGGYTPTTVGTYQWVAAYSGDSKNNAVSDNKGDEPEIVNMASPTLVTSASLKSGCYSITYSAVPEDTAVLAGAYNANGTITFKLTSPSGSIIDTEVVTVNGNGTYSTSNTTPVTAVGTYTWSATYSGNTLNNSAKDQGGSAEQIVIGASASISGTKYQDLTGNGFSSDDTGLGGVTINLFVDHDGSGTVDSADGAPVASAVTASNGTYSFQGLPTGNYLVQEVVPSGWIRTGPTLTDTYSNKITTSSQAATGDNFDNYDMVCNTSEFTNVYYVITNSSGTKTVTDLRGNTSPGDQVTAYFNYSGTDHDIATLVSYTAPDNYFNANDASQQQEFNIQTVQLTPGNQQYSLTVQLPMCNYQIDFVCGQAINQLGPANSNIFYSAQNRLISADNDGPGYCMTTTSTLSGSVFDDCDGDGVFDSNESGIAGVTVTLTGTASTGGAITLVRTTDSNGNYSFMGLPAGTYSITEAQPAGYLDGVDKVGTLGGTVSNDKVSTITVGAGKTGTGYNFGEFDPASINGVVYADKNNDGEVDFGEVGIEAVKITLTGTDVLGNAVSMTAYTDETGAYEFDNLRPSNSTGYTITEGTVTGFTDGKDTAGTINGVCTGLAGNDVFSKVGISCNGDGENYNFGEIPLSGTQLKCGMTATIAFWQNSKGQALINAMNGGSTKTSLGTWLATQFPNLFSSLKSETNSQIASYFTTCFKATNKLQAEVLGTALAVYATNSTLAGGTYASSYGFTVNTTGTGTAFFDVGTDGSTLGLTDGGSYSITSLLQTANTLKVFSASSSVQTPATDLFTNINADGDIVGMSEACEWIRRDRVARE